MSTITKTALALAGSGSEVNNYIIHITSSLARFYMCITFISHTIYFLRHRYARARILAIFWHLN
jgi:hypothetical protein